MEADPNGKASLRTIEPIVAAILVLAVGAFYFWTSGLSGAPRWSARPEGYYNLQAEGFLQGHLYTSLEPAPALLALADPYDPVANAPYRVHDMTLWHGRYYLYFGVAPVLLAFLPFRLATGLFVSEPTVVALFCLLGYAMATALLLGVRRRWYPATHPLLAALLLAALGLGSPTLLLNQMPQFYQVPIACAYALAMAGLYFGWRALWADAGGVLRWLGACGSCMGLTLAARPNYVLGAGLATLLFAWCAGRRAAARAAQGRARLGPWVAALGPVTAVGLALLVYNALRFGDPFEFGMRYQLAGRSFVDFTPLGLGYLPAHVGAYAWRGVWWLPLFPFLETGPDAPFGVLRYLPLVWLGVAALWPRPLRAEANHDGRLALAWAVASLAAANMLVDSMFFFEPVLRYLCDFAPALVLLGALGALAIGRRRWALVGALAAACSAALVMALYVQRMPEARRPRALARAADRAAAPLERLLGVRYGALKLQVELPAAPTSAVEPLFQTGYAPDRRDWLQIRYLAQGRAQIGFFHAGIGETAGVPFEVPAGRRVEIEATCGALLPAGTHPMFAGWSEEEIAAARRHVEVAVNGSAVLSAALRCYPSRPWDLRLGITGFDGDQARPRFSGRILSASLVAPRREAVPPRELKAVRGTLVLRLQLPVTAGGYEPLVTAGEPGRGELLYLVYGPGPTVQFALDTVGSRAVFSQPLAFNPADTQTVSVWIGSWALAPGGRAGWAGKLPEGSEHRLYVALDARAVLVGDLALNPGADAPVAIGWNRIDSGAAGREFTGRILSVDQAPAAAQSGVVR